MTALPENTDHEAIDLLKMYIPDAHSGMLDMKLSDLQIESIDFVSLVFDVEDKYSVDIHVSDIHMDESLRQMLQNLSTTTTS